MEKLKPYNRAAAVAYAIRYAEIPNVDQWKYYEGFGGDCTNFTSQCLYAGGIPFDHVGKSSLEKWYWYSDANRTASWTSSQAFRQYVLLNKTGPGLRAHIGQREELQLGDLVQLEEHGRSYHTMIVTGYITDPNNPKVIVDYLICQHSANFLNIPLSTKTAKLVYIIIDGYV